MKQLKKSKRSVILTVKGKAEAIVQDAGAYQRLLDIAARADVYLAIRQGLDDAAKGRTRPASEVFDEIRASMAYPVKLTQRAALDLAALFEQIHAVDSVPAALWFNGLEDAIGRLGTMLRRCPAAPKRKKIGRPLRHLLHGGKPNIYRVIFEIDELGKIVQVLTIRHGAMDELAAMDL